MRRIVFAVTSCLVLMLMTRPSIAQVYPIYVNGLQLEELCQYNELACAMYVAGVVDYRYDSGLDSIANDSPGNSADACIPMNEPLKSLTDDVAKYLKLHPEDASVNGEKVVGLTEEYFFQCWWPGKK